MCKLVLIPKQVIAAEIAVEQDDVNCRSEVMKSSDGNICDEVAVEQNHVNCR